MSGRDGSLGGLLVDEWRRVASLRAALEGLLAVVDGPESQESHVRGVWPMPTPKKWRAAVDAARDALR